MLHQDLKALRAYENYIRTLAEFKSEIEFENFDSPHASIVIKNIVDFSQKEVLIFDNDLSGDLSGNNYDAENFSDDYENYFELKKKELLESFSNHLGQGQTLKIVVRDGSLKDSQVYKTLECAIKKYPVTLSVFEASPEFKEAVKKIYKKDINFVTGDLESSRIEPKTSDCDKISRKALVCFYNPKRAKSLRKVFESYLSSCKSVF